MAITDYNSKRLEAEAVEGYKEYLKRREHLDQASGDTLVNQ